MNFMSHAIPCSLPYLAHSRAARPEDRLLEGCDPEGCAEDLWICCFVTYVGVL